MRKSYKSIILKCTKYAKTIEDHTCNPLKREKQVFCEIQLMNLILVKHQNLKTFNPLKIDSCCHKSIQQLILI